MESNDAHITQLLRSLLEQAGDYAVILITQSGDIMWCNSGAERLFGCDRLTRQAVRSSCGVKSATG